MLRKFKKNKILDNEMTEKSLKQIDKLIFQR